ncbi:D-lactate dehydrogenase [Lachancea thermotolerans CBS 6340]|uniref:D-lactate dehydrogenase (cytochrome) n=1 Tax=Lachancea thermotolerans (strain ATCC 56472 / CBS 6340 / NRRL Y-8284) TaxID=559295 RepID=C5DCP6_LACTC|nr:KLTH0B04774p [Lachancea thermotolerans CBS 6340]CAR21557.1 KLTH0B04774p [Lachancea thermotolerans CBS 6340]
MWRTGFSRSSQAWRRACTQYGRRWQSSKAWGSGASHRFAQRNSRMARVSVLAAGMAAVAGAGAASWNASVQNDEFSSTTRLDELQSPQYCHDADKFAEAVEKLKKLLNNDEECFSVSKSDLDAHSDTYFNTHHATPEQRPRIVLYPHNTEEVSEVLKICHEYAIPVVPFSGGTSLEGHFLPTRIGCTVTLDLSKYMNKIKKLNKTDLDVEVQAGVPWEDLNDFLNEKGLLFGCDPGPGAQIGGCVANSCSGTKAYRYGTMKENVVNLTAVLADGTVIKTKRRPRKSSAGYNLNGLLIGSEGTLAVVTEATIKCHVRPAFENVAVGSFPTIADAAACTSRIIQEGIQLNAMELLDDNMMRIVNKSGATYKTDWIEAPTLFFKVGGRNKKIIAELIHEVDRIAQHHGCHKFEFAKDDDERLELWEARKVALWSVINDGKSRDPDVNVWTTDVAVPLSQFANVIGATKKDMDASGLQNAIVGHAGDGNFHTFLLYNDKEREKAGRLVDSMVKRAIDAEGTCTGEHGVGMGKRGYLLEELGDAPVDFMRRLKLAADPKRILNPDKIFKIDPEDKEGH